MKTIWKFPLAGTEPDGAYIMPAGAKILSVGKDSGGDPCFWALVDTEAPKRLRFLFWAMTGEELPLQVVEAPCVGQIQMGPIVEHIFDLGEK